MQPASPCAPGSSRPERSPRPISRSSPAALYMTDAEWRACAAFAAVRMLSPFTAPRFHHSHRCGRTAGPRLCAGARPRRATDEGEHASMCSKPPPPISRSCRQSGKRVVIGCWSEGSADRMGGVLADHGVAALKRIARLAGSGGLHKSAVGLAVLGIEHGFEAPDFAILTEQDVLGDRMVRLARAGAALAEFPLRGVVADAGRSRHPYRAWHRPLSRAQSHRGAGRAA